ncbi:MAG: hypothetical protein JW801_10055, partial [Bacteroidales bacterium]|nr:hypothetical protein [Bacteroidales bacterium]
MVWFTFCTSNIRDLHTCAIIWQLFLIKVISFISGSQILSERRSFYQRVFPGLYLSASSGFSKLEQGAIAPEFVRRSGNSVIHFLKEYQKMTKFCR